MKMFVMQYLHIKHKISNYFYGFDTIGRASAQQYCEDGGVNCLLVNSKKNSSEALFDEYWLHCVRLTMIS
jgi:hypothetical protein